jgi:hypothetical protein
MKLAEALILRADLHKRIEQLKARLLRSAKVQEGDSPSEDPQELIAELERLTSEFTSTIQRINRTNSTTSFHGGPMLSDALAVRDVLGRKHTIYLELAKAAAITHDRSTKSEIKFKSTVKVVEIQRRADALAKEHRELDSRIQELNWRTDLLE